MDETLIYPEGEPRPTARDYTPCRFDPERQELDLEFALHEAGPATSWAAQAKPGQYLGIGGPRGSLVIPAAFDWHLLIGDESALPAIRRRLAELPPTAKVIALLQSSEAGQGCELPAHPNADIHWVHQGADAEPALLTALKSPGLAGGRRLCLGRRRIPRHPRGARASARGARHRQEPHPRRQLLARRPGRQPRNAGRLSRDPNDKAP